MDKTLVAVASSDGIVVNNHFGRASKFYIYSFDDSDINFEEIRELTPVCESGNHDDNDTFPFVWLQMLQAFLS